MSIKGVKSVTETSLNMRLDNNCFPNSLLDFFHLSDAEMKTTFLDGCCKLADFSLFLGGRGDAKSYC